MKDIKWLVVGSWWLVVGGLSAVASEVSLLSVGVEGVGKRLDTAKAELVKHLGLVSGKTPSDAGEFTIVLGAKAPGEPDPHPFYSYAKRDGARLYLWGDDSEDHPGTLFAVYGFLERILGVRWVMPGDEGIVAPKAEKAEIPDGWTWSYTPPLDDGMIRCTAKGHAADSRQMRNMKYAPEPLRHSVEREEELSAMRREWRLRMKMFRKTAIPFGHAFISWPKRFAKTHPEYLAMDKSGKRGGGNPKYSKLCISNEAVVDQVIADWEKRGKPKYLNVCPNDGENYCVCEKCRALDVPREGEPDLRHLTDRYLNFWNRICRKVLAIRPDAILCTYAYSNYREPPRREKVEFPDHMIFGMVPSIEDDNAALIAGWRQAGMKSFKLRPNYLHYYGWIPRGYERFFLENLKFNRREGMIGADYDAMLRDELMGFEAYAIARGIQNPEVAFETVESEWLSQFGAAAPKMRQYYERVRTRGETALKAAQARKAGEREVVLDDSLLFGTVVSASPREELETDLKIANEAAATEGLSELEHLRVRRIAALAEHAIKTRDFMVTMRRTSFEDETIVDTNRFVQAGLDLIDCRVRIAPMFPHAAWGVTFRAFPFEVRWWMKKPIKSEVNKRYPSTSVP